MSNTVPNVRSKLATVLSGKLGKYTRPSGSTTPALWILPVPDGYTITSGVEVVIRPDTDPTTEVLLNNEFHMHGAISLRVIGHDNARLDPVVDLILRAFPESEARYIPGDEQLGILNQATINIPK